MCETFVYPKQKKEGKTQWEIEFEVIGNYRNFVLMKQIDSTIDKQKVVPVIGLNPGTFRSEETYGGDTTLKILRKIFENSGYGIEVLNLYSIIEPEPEKLKLIDESNRNKSDYLKKRLKQYSQNTKIIMMCGKPIDYNTQNRFDEIKGMIDENNVLGWSNKTNEFYYHPIYLQRSKKVLEFRQRILSKLDTNKV